MASNSSAVANKWAVNDVVDRVKRECYFQWPKIRYWLATHPSFTGTIASIAVSEVIQYLYFKWRNRVPRNCFLEIDLSDKVLVEDTQEALEWLNPERVSARDLHDALVKATTDTRIIGIVCKLGRVEGSLMAMQEIRDAVLAFNASGKHSVVYAPSLSEFGQGIKYYWFASAFKTVVVGSSAMVSITGLRVENAFFRGTLDKLNITPQFFRRKEYKGAIEAIVNKEMSKEAKEVATEWHDAIMQQFISDIAKGRNLEEGVVKKIIDGGPYMAKEALELKLVDSLHYADEVYESLLVPKAGVASVAKLSLLYSTKYIKNVKRQHREGKKSIAVINVKGAIIQGRTDAHDTSFIGADTVIAGLRQAVADSKIKAIILKIDSPGGSYVASDIICREIDKAKAAGKKVVAWMASVAASGGYYVACHADHIVAMPLTVTGSIGVFFGKFNTKGMWEKIGVSFDGFMASPNGGYWSSLHDFTDTEKQTTEKLLDYIYDDFTGKVASGRKLTREAVEAVAKGRIWSGHQAKANGLIDEVGNFDSAVAVAKSLAGIPATTEVALKKYPSISFIWTLLGYRNSREGHGLHSSIFNPTAFLLNGFVQAASYVSFIHNVPGLREAMRALAFLGVTLPRGAVENGPMAMDLNAALSPLDME